MDASGTSSVGEDLKSQESEEYVGAAQLSVALSHNQRVVLDLMMDGMDVPKSAAKAGVHRGTVNRWMLSDENFIAARNARIMELVAAHHAKLLAMVPKALAAIEEAIENGDARLAMQLLKIVMGTPQKMLPISSSIVAEQLKVAEQQQQVELQKKRVTLEAEQEQAFDKSKAVGVARWARKQEEKPFLQRYEDGQRFYHTGMAEGPITQAKMDEISARVAAEVKQMMAERLKPKPATTSPDAPQPASQQHLHTPAPDPAESQNPPARSPR